MDMAKLFFAVMFGGDKFEPYIGQLGLSAFMDALTGEMAAAQGAARADGPSLDLDEMKKVIDIRPYLYFNPLALSLSHPIAIPPLPTRTASQPPTHCHTTPTALTSLITANHRCKFNARFGVPLP
jgi:hypothetical protein